MKLFKWLDRYFEILFIAIGLAIICIVMTAQIITRRILGYSIAWSEECCRHIFIFMCIWGVSLTIRENSAIKLDILFRFLSEKMVAIINIISYAIMIVFFIPLLKSTYNATISMNRTSATMMPYNLSVVYGAVFFGLIMTILRLVQMMVISLKKYVTIKNNMTKTKEA